MARRSFVLTRQNSFSPSKISSSACPARGDADARGDTTRLPTAVLGWVWSCGFSNRCFSAFHARLSMLWQ